MDFSWSPGSGSGDPGSWEISISGKAVATSGRPGQTIYTLLQKKGNFQNVAFLLRKSVHVPPGENKRILSKNATGGEADRQMDMNSSNSISLLLSLLSDY